MHIQGRALRFLCTNGVDLGAPTAGCIALARPDIHWLATRAVPGTRLIVR